MLRTFPSLILVVYLFSSLGAAEESSYDKIPAYKNLTPSEWVGKEIWYKATAGNKRYHTYAAEQRMGVLMDWYRVFNADERDERFNTWGVTNDPDCCKPGSPGCPATSLEQTFGMDWCPGDGRPWAGDDGLLSHVGKNDYVDPACSLKDVSGAEKQSACDLEFGTSLGGVGFRKFPNPRFDAAQWKKVNGGTLGTWAGFNRRLPDRTKPNGGDPRDRQSHMADASVEPPFLIGISCASCHVSFNPLKPPKDPSHPAWENIDLTIGGQYIRISEILASGMPRNSLEWQTYTHARPGVTDTSAVPNDFISNPGTINAIFNFDRKNKFTHRVLTWRPVEACARSQSAVTLTSADADPDRCWCEPGKAKKCWEKSMKEEEVLHILKGAEDSVGPAGAVQRVYINIGSCSEQCWLNHLTDVKQIDPKARNFGQTPFDIGQCRRDCPNFRAIEDRVGDLENFLIHRRPTDLHQTDYYQEIAKKPEYTDQGLESDEVLEKELEKTFGEGAVKRGQVVFANNCARCHSSQKPPFNQYTFREPVNPADPKSPRRDWLGNDQRTPATEIKTYWGRALHSNHKKGHVWEEYASETYRAWPEVPGMDPNGGGPGYLRNISLLSVWATAPFLHNNALGPEICGDAKDPKNQFYRSSYEGEEPPPNCVKVDPSVPGRLALFKASMEELLTKPEKRRKKITRTDTDIELDLTPKIWLGDPNLPPVGVTLVIPAGTSTARLGSFDHKRFARDLVLSIADPAKVKENLKRFGNEADTIAAKMKETAEAILKSPTLNKRIVADRDRLNLYLRAYSNNTAEMENDGHPQGSDLKEQEKNDLIAFLATL
jgi:hypothetical protein